MLSIPWQNEVNETSSSRATQSDKKRSTLKNAGISGLDEISLNFEDSPQINSPKDESQDFEDHSPSGAAIGDSRDAEWSFLPLLPYEGHSQDKLLRGLIQTHLSTYIEDFRTKETTAARSRNGLTRGNSVEKNPNSGISR